MYSYNFAQLFFIFAKLFTKNIHEVFITIYNKKSN